MTNTQAGQRQPDPTEQHPHHAYYQLAHALCTYLPPPLADTPEATLIRNQAAIARVASLLPVNADEADMAAHCIAARDHAADVGRLIGEHAGNIELVMKLRAQYALMERTAISIRNQLARVQSERRKRQASAVVANNDAWAEYRAGHQMQLALDEGGLPSVRPAAEPPTGPMLAMSAEPLRPPVFVPAPGVPPPTQAVAAGKRPRWPLPRRRRCRPSCRRQPGRPPNRWWRVLALAAA